MAEVRRLKISKDGYDPFEVLITDKAGREELWVAVDHYIVPDASADRKVICLGLGGLDAKEFDYEVDKLISNLNALKQLAANHFAKR